MDMSVYSAEAASIPEESLPEEIRYFPEAARRERLELLKRLARQKQAEGQTGFY
jgi:hypothetical protein